MKHSAFRILWSMGSIMLLNFVAAGQSAEWKIFSNCETVQGITEDATSLWLATSGGIVKCEKATYRTDVLTKADIPLPFSNVLCAASDQRGNLWFGTFGGAVKFDGANWSVFDNTNSGLPSNVVYGITGDKNNNVWFATSAGVARWNGTDWTVYNNQNTPAINIFSFRCICSAPDGTIWAGSSSDFYQQGGLFKFDGATWTAFNMQNSSIPDYIINALAVDQHGILWIGTSSKGLAKFDGSSFTVYDQNNSTIADVSISGLSIDSNGTIWIATKQYLKTGGVSSFDGSHFTTPGFPVVNPLSILASENGTIYAGTDGAGLATQIGSTWTLQKVSNNPLPSNNVTCVLSDSWNIKWFGTDAGLCKFDDPAWIVYDTASTPIKLPSDNVLCLAEDRQGIIWVGTKKGIVEINGSTSTIYNATSQTPVYAEWVQGIAIDADNSVWFATNSGLIKYDRSTWQYYGSSTIPPLPDYLSNFMAVFADHNNNIWASVNGFGILKFDGTNWTSFTPSNSAMRYAAIQALCEDDRGKIYAGAYGQSPDGSNGGLFIYDGSVWSNVRKNNSQLPGNYIVSITKSPGGELWIGAQDWGGAQIGGGIAIIDTASQWRVVTCANSKLPYPYINGLDFDRSGNAWIGSMASGALEYKQNGIVGIDSPPMPSLPEELALLQNYPNPFNPVTTIRFELDEPCRATLAVYDVLGREVDILVSNDLPRGSYSVQWDGSNRPSGVYFCRLSSVRLQTSGNTGSTRTIKILMVK